MNSKNPTDAVEDAACVGSSGNVFEDLGFDNPDLELAKSALVHRLRQEIAARGLSQAVAGKIMGIKQPKLTALLNADWKSTSIDRLLTYLSKLGVDIEMTLRGTPGKPAATRPAHVREVKHPMRIGRLTVVA